MGSSWASADECRWIDEQDTFQMAIEASKYAPTLQTCDDLQQRDWVTLRSFPQSGQTWFLVVDPQGLRTRLATAACLQSCRETLPEQLPGLYGEILDRAFAPPEPLQNDGLTRALHSRKEIFLTVDLCPSKKPLDYSLFQNLAAEKNKPIQGHPIGIALSGGWTRSHPADLKWIRDLIRTRHLDVTWVNHSDTHPYQAGTSLQQNFLLLPQVNFGREVLDAEREFLKQGLIPSIYFRFPGLVSSPDLMAKLKRLGILPLGSEAWLAKGDKVQDGSIILIHGNGNEPPGLLLWHELLTKKNAAAFLRRLENLFF